MKYDVINNSKKLILICIIQLFFLSFNNSCLGISDEFKFVIDTIGVPKTNINGEEINETIYQLYKVFVYSSPIEVANNTNLQRFKEVKNNGKWYEEKTGVKGEYYILGTDYNGNFVTNVYFPTDFIPETTPNKWNYIYNESAIDSWNDSAKYKYKEQLEYMKNSNILFDNIDFENKICDSYNLVEYDISANDIGLDKAFLETCSTWTTSGVISVKRLTTDNKIRYATFFVKPMAASANIESFLEIDDDINLTSDSQKINIKFGANVINLNDYAKEEHIKEINSEIYIGNIKIDSIKSTQNRFVDKNILYEIPKEFFEKKTEMLNIKVKSYLYTEFSVDGLLQDIVEKNITIHKDVLNDIVPADNILVKVLEKSNGKLILKDLVKTKNTESSNSIGILEKGKYLAVKINNVNVDNVDNIKTFINNEEYKVDFFCIGKDIVFKLRVEELNNDTSFNTICTWKYLRDLSNNYFNIKFTDIGKRIKDVNVLKVIIKDKEYSTNFDIVDNYFYNMNYTFLDEIINKEELSKEIGLEEWLI